MNFRLPYPPSVNTYWRKWNNRMVISGKGKEYRRDVVAQFADQGIDPLEGELSVSLELIMPDRRRRDIDNVLKCLFDSMEHAGLYHDDSQIADLHVTKLHVEPPGCVDVILMPYIASH